MTAKEMLENEGYTEKDQCEGYVLKVSEMTELIETYAKQHAIKYGKSLVNEVYLDNEWDEFYNQFTEEKNNE